MTIPQNIEELAHKVRNEIYGRDVREAIASSIEATAEVAEWSRQVAQQIIDGEFDEAELLTEIERKLNELEQEYAPELTNIKNEVEDARGNESTLGNRLDGFSSQLAQTTAETHKKINRTEVVDSLSEKVDKGGNEQVTWGMLDQSVKENITGGNTPVVGEDSVNTTNVVDNAITSTKRTSLGEWGLLTGSEPINFNFESGMIEFPNAVDIFHRGLRYALASPSPLPMNPEELSVNRFILFFDILNRTFLVTPLIGVSPVTENHIVLATYRVPSREVFSLGKYLVDGYPSMSGGLRNDVTYSQDIFYRYNVPQIEGNTITFKPPFQLYVYPINLGVYANTLIINENITLPWQHNSVIVWDILDSKIKHVTYPERLTNGEIVLFKNVDGKMVSGALMSQYLSDQTHITIKNKRYKTVPTPINKTKITRSGSPNGGVVVGDEYWTFYASSDDHSDYADCHRWKIEDDYSLTYIDSFEHNWGHCNSLDYRNETDTLILGNGSGDYNLSGKIFIIPNASQLKTVTQAPLINVAFEIDVGMSYGSKVNVVWGDDNFGRFDIAHIITNDNKNIRRIQLGKGDNEFPLGQFITDQGENQFNGTFKIIGEFSQEDGGDVVQGACYGRDGYLYVGLGHSGVWYSKQYLNENGSISCEVVKSLLYNSDGTLGVGYTQSVSEYKDKLIIRVIKDWEEYAFVINK